jgi:hypothetical protein
MTQIFPDAGRFPEAVHARKSSAEAGIGASAARGGPTAEPSPPAFGSQPASSIYGRSENDLRSGTASGELPGRVTGREAAAPAAGQMVPISP